MLVRLVRIFNVGAAILIALVLVAVYWYALRPLPAISGQIQAPISGRASIRRDERGVPHIEAASWRDALFLQGFVTAQDRLWQMDTLRRFGAGELAEVFGKVALPSDQRSRAMRMRALAETNAARLSGDERIAVIEYARGVNYFIETHRGRYALEFSLPGHGYDPKPWTPVDSMLVGLVMYRDLTDSSKFEYEKGELLEKANASAVRTLFPLSQGARLSPGSNAWAVSGAHTASGKPLLANDPHLAYAIPGTWHLVHLKAPGLNVSGAALPGVPCVITGHNEQIAWGVTNMQTDVMDLYAEQLDERTGRYVFQGKTAQAVLNRQMIGVRGSKPVEIVNWVTRHGPVVLHEKGRNFSLRWSAADGFSFPFLAIDRASNWDEFRAPLRDYWGPGQNFVYADRTGNIGYQATGRMPIRGDGKSVIYSDAPLDGASGAAEWTGYIPFDRMPSLYNPASGIIATANQNPFSQDFPNAVPGSYADRYRIVQIRSLLSARNGWKAPQMVAVQKDVYSAYHHFLAKEILKAIDRSKASGLGEVVDVLRPWNGQMEHDLAAPAITELLNAQLSQNLVQTLLLNSNRNSSPTQPSVAPEKTGGRPQDKMPAADTPNILPRPQIIQMLLKQRPHGWVPKDDWDSWMLQNLRTAISLGRNQQGSAIEKWRWGRILQWKLAHPIGKELPIVDRFFDIGPVEMSGSGTTVKQTTATLGPSERMVVDLGNLDHSLQNLPAGESGMVASKHYKDQWNAYYYGQSFPMEFSNVTAKNVLQVEPLPQNKAK